MSEKGECVVWGHGEVLGNLDETYVGLQNFRIIQCYSINF